MAVLRAGLEEVIAGEALSPAGREEIADLIHQTFRLTSIVEDLLLLSRLDAGRLSLAFSSVDLRALIEAGLDDLGTQPEGNELKIETVRTRVTTSGRADAPRACRGRAIPADTTANAVHGNRAVKKRPRKGALRVRRNTAAQSNRATPPFIPAEMQGR